MKNVPFFLFLLSFLLLFGSCDTAKHKKTAPTASTGKDEKKDKPKDKETKAGGGLKDEDEEHALFHSKLKGVDKCIFNYKQQLVDKKIFFSREFDSIPENERIKSVFEGDIKNSQRLNLEFQTDFFDQNLIGQKIYFTYNPQIEKANVMDEIVYEFYKVNNVGKIGIIFSKFENDILKISAKQEININEVDCSLVLFNEEITHVDQEENIMNENITNYYSRSEKDVSSHKPPVEKNKKEFSLVSFVSLVKKLDMLHENLYGYQIFNISKKTLYDLDFILEDKKLLGGIAGEDKVFKYNYKRHDTDEGVESTNYFSFRRHLLTDLRPLYFLNQEDGIIEKTNSQYSWLHQNLNNVLDSNYNVKINAKPEDFKLTKEFAQKSIHYEINVPYEYSFKDYLEYFDDIKLLKKSSAQNPFNTYEVKASNKQIDIKFQDFKRIWDLAPEKLSIDVNLFKEFLKPSYYFDYDNEIVKKELDLLKRKYAVDERSHPILKIYSVYKYLHEEIKQYPSPQENIDFNSPKLASALLRTHQITPGQYSIVFTTLARALGIPCRLVSGYKITSEKVFAAIWVEVNFDGSRWFPIEPLPVEEIFVSDKYFMLNMVLFGRDFDTFPVKRLDDDSIDFIIYFPSLISVK